MGAGCGGVRGLCGLNRGVERGLVEPAAICRVFFAVICRAELAETEFVECADGVRLILFGNVLGERVSDKVLGSSVF